MPSLEDDAKAAALIGTFMLAWSRLEAVLNDAVGKALGLDDQQREILWFLTTVDNRISALKIAGNEGGFQNPEGDGFNGFVELVRNMQVDRNFVAHAKISSGSEGTMTLRWGKARDDFKPRLETWGEAEIAAACVKMEDYSNRLEAIRDAMPARQMFAVLNEVAAAGDRYWGHVEAAPVAALSPGTIINRSD